MKYDTPELTALTPAINAIQFGKTSVPDTDHPGHPYDIAAAYEDWE